MSKPTTFPFDKIDDSWTLFLDRDGTINKRLKDAYVMNWAEFEFLPGVKEVMGFLGKLFGKIIIVTNQQGIGKELMSHEDLRNIHAQMLEEILWDGGRIDQIYYAADLAIYNPPSRKPNPGMAFQAKEDFPEIDFSKSVMIGDEETDVLFGSQLKMKTIRLGNKHTETQADLLIESLSDLLKYF